MIYILLGGLFIFTFPTWWQFELKSIKIAFWVASTIRRIGLHEKNKTLLLFNMSFLNLQTANCHFTMSRLKSAIVFLPKHKDTPISLLT